MQTRKRWKNYVDDQGADPLQFFAPQTLQELCVILADAGTSGLKVKAVGSGHSSSDIAISRDIMIDTHGLDRVLDKNYLDLNVSSSNLFFIECGIRISALNKTLEEQGKALINMGAYDGQTVAGVISTSTHGSGISLGAFPDYVRAIFLLGEDGTLYHLERSQGHGISKGPAKIPGSDPVVFIQDDDYFYSVGVSMGCMGVIYAVVLEVCEKYMLKECRYFSDWKTMKTKLQAGTILKANRHLEVLVSPYLNKKQEYKCLVTERSIVPAKYRSPLIRRGHRKVIPEIGVRLIPKVLDFFIRFIINHFPKRIPWVAQSELNTLADSDYVDKSYKVLNLGADNNLAAFATEIALPANRYIEAVEEIIKTVNNSVAEGRQYLSSPFSLRFVKTNSFFLSMQYGPPEEFVCMIEFPTVSRTIGATEMLARIEDALYKFGGIPHWGQINHVGGQGQSAVQRLYPRFPDWMRIYNKLCPEGRFENDFTHRCGISHFKDSMSLQKNIYMSRLSSPITEIKKKYDVIVIGSGYGGSITASRMARAGKNVCLLERGKEYHPEEFPKTFAQSSPMTQIDTPALHIGKKFGLFDVRVNKEINVVQGCGLGGTSLINANVGMQPVPDVLKDRVWPAALRNDPIGLQPFYDAAKTMLDVNTYPADRPIPAKVNSMQTAAQNMNIKEKWSFTPVYVNFTINGDNPHGVHQEPCIGCGECCSGCNFHAKNTMMMNYLPDAKNHGAEIYTQVNVRYIEKTNGGWRIHYNIFNTGDEHYDSPTDFITAPVVVLAAGSLGSTEIMLRSGENGLSCSEKLGENFSGNGDFLAFGYNNDLRANSIGIGTNPKNEADPVGPNIASIIDLRNDKDDPDAMIIEEGVVPGFMAHTFKDLVITAADLEGINTSKGLADELRKAERRVASTLEGPYHGSVNHTMTYLVMVKDDDRGQMILDKDSLRIDWPNAGEQPIYQKVNEKLLGLTRALDGVYTRNPLWTRLFSDQLVTVHPLGGCIMADDASGGVVNHKGQVFSGTNGDTVHEGLYISDGSIVPRSLGINPSLTISALAERNCYYITRDNNWNIKND